MDDLYHIIVSGAVQGVGFRYHTEYSAQRLGIAGWVRNVSGGDVEILARIPSGKKEKFLRDIQTGPPMARVNNVNLRRAPENMNCPEKGFTVRY